MTLEKEVICKDNMVAPPETQRRNLIKSVHDNILGGIAATQKGHQTRSVMTMI